MIIVIVEIIGLILLGLFLYSLIGVCVARAVFLICSSKTTVGEKFDEWCWDFDAVAILVGALWPIAIFIFPMICVVAFASEWALSSPDAARKRRAERKENREIKRQAAKCPVSLKEIEEDLKALH